MMFGYLPAYINCTHRMHGRYLQRNEIKVMQFPHTILPVICHLRAIEIVRYHVL
jgi:hypothetical protein